MSNITELSGLRQDLRERVATQRGLADLAARRQDAEDHDAHLQCALSLEAQVVALDAAIEALRERSHSPGACTEVLPGRPEQHEDGAALAAANE